MTDSTNDWLLIAGRWLTIIIQAILAFGAGIVTLVIPMLLIFQDQINAKVAQETVGAGTMPLMALLCLLVLVVGMLVLGFVFFGKLRAIIATVADGDPFVPDNSDRLSMMAWLMLSLQVTMVPIFALTAHISKWTEQIDNSDLQADFSMDIEGILMVITLFILARVFRKGTEMRDDLEGTV